MVFTLTYNQGRPGVSRHCSLREHFDAGLFQFQFRVCLEICGFQTVCFRVFLQSFPQRRQRPQVP